MPDELAKLIDKPVEFFRRLQAMYVFKNVKLSRIFKEIADEHERQA